MFLPVAGEVGMRVYAFILVTRATTVGVVIRERHTWTSDATHLFISLLSSVVVRTRVLFLATSHHISYEMLISLKWAAGFDISLHIFITNLSLVIFLVCVRVCVLE